MARHKACNMVHRLARPRFRHSSAGHGPARAAQDPHPPGTMKHFPVAARLVACLLAASCDVPRTEPGDPPADPAPPAATIPAMAVTIDDLPWIGALRPGESRAEALQRMIDALVSRDVPAMAFPNCGRVGAGAPTLRQWLEAGLELGNHTAAHLDLNRAPLQQWLRDVRTCHDMLQGLTGADTLWFRYPFLHQGPDAPRQQAALDLLAELGSPIAHVTIDNSDWILAVAYGEAVRAGDEDRAAAVADAFIDHILRATGHYQQVAQRKVGRDVPHVLLLHANLLVADQMGRLLDELGARGFRFISVSEAHRDPVYALPDEYTGSDGLSWLYRMQPATPEDKAWDDAEAARLRGRWR
jgi:peptidoglycan/xylan/chitin deacetylase (PgdA/CDA1 family)